MQIDVISVASVAPENESSASPAEAGKAHGSFADLLDAVAEDQNESASADEADEEDTTGDDWMTVPVVVPFVPAIPQDVVKAEDGDATSVEAIGEDIAVAAGEVAQQDVAVASDVTTLIEGDTSKPTKTKPEAPTVAKVESTAEGQAVQAGDIQTTTAATITATETAASLGSKESFAAEPTPKPATEAKATAPKTSEANEVNKALAAEATVTSAIQVAVKEGVAATEEGASKKTTNEPAAGTKGVAARLARALERATESALAPAAQTGENNQASNQNNGGQPSFGEWLREQLPQLNASRGHGSANPAFTFVAPAHNDVRVSGVLASAGPNPLPSTVTLPNEQDVNLQIVQSMRMQFRDGIGEAVLKLKPEHLGTVSISLKVENGGLKANVQADMPAVRQWLESQQDTLRSALAEHGLRLDQFDVEPDAQRQQADDEGQREQSRKRQAQKREAEQPVFEVVV